MNILRTFPSMKMLTAVLLLLAVRVSAPAQLWTSAGPALMWYNLSQEKGKNIFDEKGPNFHVGANLRAGWQMGAHGALGISGHYFWPKDEKRTAYVYTQPPLPPGRQQVESVEYTHAWSAEVLYRGYFAGDTSDYKRLYIVAGVGYSRFVRNRQLSPYDSIYVSLEPLDVSIPLVPVHLGIGFETGAKPAYLFAEARLQGSLTGGNEQYVTIELGVHVPFDFRRK